MEMLPKRKSRAFGNDVYLIGRNKYGDLIWLEAARFERDWYWGFGYVEIYTNQDKPSAAKDITSHHHWNRMMEDGDNEKHVYHINELLQQSVLTDKESWSLADLMQSYYTLKECAAVVGRGGSHLSGTDNPQAITDKDMAHKINKVLLPALFEEIYKIISPSSEVEV